MKHKISYENTLICGTLVNPTKLLSHSRYLEQTGPILAPRKHTKRVKLISLQQRIGKLILAAWGDLHILFIQEKGQASNTMAFGKK